MGLSLQIPLLPLVVVPPWGRQQWQPIPSRRHQEQAVLGWVTA